MEKKRETKTIYRLVPCPQYDLSGMEHWLSDMAQNGWLLQKEGITFAKDYELVSQLEKIKGVNIG